MNNQPSTEPADNTASAPVVIPPNIGVGLTEVAQHYLPAFRRMTINELTNTVSFIAEQSIDAARRVAQAKMSASELADEKEALTDLARLMADSNAAKQAFGRQLFTAALTAALNEMLAAVIAL